MANDVEFRLATEQDLERIVEMLADDKLGATREQFVLPLPEVYRTAFRAIDADPNNELVVACLGNEVIGVQQITYTPYLTRQGGWRATIEGVRTSSTVRGKGIGTKLINEAIQRAKNEAATSFSSLRINSGKTHYAFMNGWVLKRRMKG